MMTRHTLTALAAAVAVGLGGGAPLVAQDATLRQQQQMMARLQDQVTRLNETMQRMTQIQQRAQQMERTVMQEMTRLRMQEGAQDAVMLQNHERLRLMAQATSDGAREMHQAMEQFRDMLGQPNPRWNAEMEREFARLREHWGDVADRMEEGLVIMERLRDRIRLQDPS